MFGRPHAAPYSLSVAAQLACTAASVWMVQSSAETSAQNRNRATVPLSPVVGSRRKRQLTSADLPNSPDTGANQHTTASIRIPRTQRHKFLIPAVELRRCNLGQAAARPRRCSSTRLHSFGVGESGATSGIQRTACNPKGDAPCSTSVSRYGGTTKNRIDYLLACIRCWVRPTHTGVAPASGILPRAPSAGAPRGATPTVESSALITSVRSTSRTSGTNEFGSTCHPVVRPIVVLRRRHRARNWRWLFQAHTYSHQICYFMICGDFTPSWRNP